MRRTSKRLITTPGTFFSQLQWSQHHSAIVAGFLLVALVETLVGNPGVWFEYYVSLARAYFHVPADLALWAVAFAKLIVLWLGVYAITSAVWLVGSLIGERGSHRVLLRRLTVVFTTLLLARTVEHLSAHYPQLFYLALALYGWGLLLGFHALREQFVLSTVETFMVTIFTASVVYASFQYAAPTLNRYSAFYLRKAVVAYSLRQAPPSAPLARKRSKVR